jgi:hypothetical protein
VSSTATPTLIKGYSHSLPVWCRFSFQNRALIAGGGQPASAAEKLKTTFVEELPFKIMLRELPST